MYAATTVASPTDVAHLITPYILTSLNTCIKFYYWVHSGALNVKVSNVLYDFCSHLYV